MSDDEPGSDSESEPTTPRLDTANKNGDLEEKNALYIAIVLKVTDDNLEFEFDTIDEYTITLEKTKGKTFAFQPVDIPGIINMTNNFIYEPNNSYKFVIYGYQLLCINNNKQSTTERKPFEIKLIDPASITTVKPRGLNLKEALFLLTLTPELFIYRVVRELKKKYNEQSEYIGNVLANHVKPDDKSTFLFIEKRPRVTQILDSFPKRNTIVITACYTNLQEIIKLFPYSIHNITDILSVLVYLYNSNAKYSINEIYSKLYSLPGEIQLLEEKLLEEKEKAPPSNASNISGFEDLLEDKRETMKTMTSLKNYFETMFMGVLNDNIKNTYIIRALIKEQFLEVDYDSTINKINGILKTYQGKQTETPEEKKADSDPFEKLSLLLLYVITQFKKATELKQKNKSAEVFFNIELKEVWSPFMEFAKTLKALKIKKNIMNTTQPMYDFDNSIQKYYDIITKQTSS